MNYTNMTPSHYYLDCNNSLQTKNKLQAEFAAYLQSLEKKLIDASGLEKLKKAILNKSEELNSKFPRCTPIVVYYYTNTTTGTLVIHGFYAVTFSIKPAYYESNQN